MENKTDEKPKEPEEESTPADAGEGIQQETISQLDRADSIAERLKRENDRKEIALTREEALAARRAVGGISEAGQTPKKKSEDEAWADDAKERYAGTGLDPTDDDTPVTYA